MTTSENQEDGITADQRESSPSLLAKVVVQPPSQEEVDALALKVDEVSFN